LNFKPARRTSRGTIGTSMSEAITANRLIDGVVVFQDAQGGWSEDFAGAAIYPDGAATAAAMVAAKRDADGDIVVEPYAIIVEQRGVHYAPKTLREMIRASGPTNRPDLGKQAEGLAPRRSERPHVSL
jgi:hypothetical protein